MPATYWPLVPNPYPACFLVINDHSRGTEIQLTIFSIQLDCVLIIKLILVKSTVNPTRQIVKLEMWA